MELTYRKIRKSDKKAVKRIINESFCLYRYVDNKKVLESFLNAYLYSCLSEATFACVAEKDGKVIGVIMGSAKNDYHMGEHLNSILTMGYYQTEMFFKLLILGNHFDAYKRMHGIYHELLKGCNQNFDGVLTLFAVTEDCRGLGVGKELLHRLLAYQREQRIKKIYLYTDSTCNIGFYEHHGFERLGEQSASMMCGHEKIEMDVYLYGFEIK